MSNEIHQEFNKFMGEILIKSREAEDKLIQERDKLIKEIEDLNKCLAKERSDSAKLIYELNEQNKRLTKMIGDSVIKLNVGGTIFETTWATLDNPRSLYFHDANWSSYLRGAPFIDRDPAMFPYVLNILRGFPLPALTAREEFLLEQDAKFYKLLLPGREVNIIDYLQQMNPGQELYGLVGISSHNKSASDFPALFQNGNKKAFVFTRVMDEVVLRFTFSVNVKLSRYMLRQSEGFLRNWTLEVLNETPNIIREHKDDNTIGPNQPGTWTIDQALNVYGRVFRLRTKQSPISLLEVQFWGVIQEQYDK